MRSGYASTLSGKIACATGKPAELISSHLKPLQGFIYSCCGVSVVLQMSIVNDMRALFRSVASKTAQQKYLHAALFVQSIAVYQCCTAK